MKVVGGGVQIYEHTARSGNLSMFIMNGLEKVSVLQHAVLHPW